MASQPANSDISVHRRVRAYRSDRRHESIKTVTDRLSTLVMSTPGEEVFAEYLLNDAAPSFRSDAFRFGHKVLLSRTEPVAFTDAVSGLSGINFPIQIGRDKFIEKDDSNVTDDLHDELRDLNTDITYVNTTANEV